jgi:16S rRNA processing protein RimM
MTIAIPPDLIPVGHITGAYGVQGWVKIHPYSPEASALLHAKTWWIGRPSGRSTSTSDIHSEALADVHDVDKLEAKFHGDGLVARMMGVVGRDAAENLKGSVVHVQRSHFPVLSGNEFYWLDLIGLAVENCQGENLGVVSNLIDNGAHPILRVTQVNDQSNHESIQGEALAREYLIPFVDHFVPCVDQKNKKIIVDWGLDY